MSSAAVYKALVEDPLLTGYGLGDNSVFSDYSSETVPREGRFVVLRWGNQQYRGEVRTGATVLTVWVHQPETMGSDFTIINQIHDRIRTVLTEMEQVPGADGVKVTSVYFDGLGGSQQDPGFHTITKNAGYRVLLRVVG